MVAAAIGCAPMSAGDARAQAQPVASARARAAAQQKIGAPLRQEILRAQGQSDAAGPAPEGKPLVQIDKDRRALVDLRVDSTPALVDAIGKMKGTIVSTFPQYHSVIAWIPILEIENLALDPSILAIVPAQGARTQ
jgi:hypothetical protein